MNITKKLKQKRYQQIWDEYCGFLDLTLSGYMSIQRRLLTEQLNLYKESELGKKILKGRVPTSIDEFRSYIPLSTYNDYADTLLSKSSSCLPAEPSIWIETTWEGGKHPVKVAPYSRAMIDGHRSNCIACMILLTSNKKRSFTLRGGDNILYGLATLPYLTGILPYLFEDELDVNFLPPTKTAEKMSFSQRNKEGFKLGMRYGLDLFFGLSSVVSYMSENFSKGIGDSYNPFLTSPKMNYRIVKAFLRKAFSKIDIKPKDIFKLKGLACAGTDSALFKNKLEFYWGVRPLEVFGGTEATWMATETWSKNGLVFFPDACFYEFIPEDEMEKNLLDPSYIPKTYLMDELREGVTYELVITNFKGGAFVRYRIGDMFKCLRLKNENDELDYPQFAFVDRVPSVIDISGFTRITERTIDEAINLSRLSVSKWFACKEFDTQKRAYMHLYLESDDSHESVMTANIIKEHLTIYFRHVDSDYKDLKMMLGIDPLVVTVLPNGTIDECQQKLDMKVRRINPPHSVTTEIRRIISEKGALI